jgi:hypothetical protein
MKGCKNIIINILPTKNKPTKHKNVFTEVTLMEETP